MSCTCIQPVRPEFKDSYKDLLDKPRINNRILDGNVLSKDLGLNYSADLADKPRINGVTLNGNLSLDDLGIKAGAKFKIVPQLPVSDIDDTTIYLVPVQVGQADNIYQEWIYINDAWEKIGEPINIDVGIKTKAISSYVGSISYEYLSDHRFDVILDLNTLNEIRTNGDPLEDNTLYIPCPMSNGAAVLIQGPSEYETGVRYLSPRTGESSVMIGQYPTIATNMFWVVNGKVWFSEISYIG